MRFTLSLVVCLLTTITLAVPYICTWTNRYQVTLDCPYTCIDERFCVKKTWQDGDCAISLAGDCYEGPGLVLVNVDTYLCTQTWGQGCLCDEGEHISHTWYLGQGQVCDDEPL